MNILVITHVIIGEGIVLDFDIKVGNRIDPPTCSHRHACEAAPFPFPVPRRLPLWQPVGRLGRRQSHRLGIHRLQRLDKEVMSRSSWLVSALDLNRRSRYLSRHLQDERRQHKLYTLTERFEDPQPSPRDRNKPIVFSTAESRRHIEHRFRAIYLS